MTLILTSYVDLTMTLEVLPYGGGWLTGQALSSPLGEVRHCKYFDLCSLVISSCIPSRATWCQHKQLQAVKVQDSTWLGQQIGSENMVFCLFVFNLSSKG